MDTNCKNENVFTLKHSQFETKNEVHNAIHENVEINTMTRSFNIRPKSVILLILDINYTTALILIFGMEGSAPPLWAPLQTPSLRRDRSLYAFDHNIYAQKS